MWRAFFFLFAVIAGSATEIPAGTELELRLMTRVSTSTSKPGDAVDAVLIVPVLVEERVILAAGSHVSGVVKTVVPAEPRAQLTLVFSQLAAAGASLKLDARLMAVDNARETVDEAGRIIGMDGSQAYTARMDQALGKLRSSERFGGLAAVLDVAKQVLVHDTDPNITYEPGVEFTVKLVHPLNVARLPAEPSLAPFPEQDGLAGLVNRQTFQTYSQRPYRPSDVTSILLIGTEGQVRAAFADAQWSGAERLNDASRFETARAMIEQRGYKEAPVSVLLLDERPPEMVFQKGNNTFAARHHIRIWRAPDLYLGLPVWVCSATHDIGIALSQKDVTFIHSIDSKIDRERGKVVSDLLFAGHVKSLAAVGRPAVPLRSVNATGDALETDGRMAVLLLQ